MAAAGARPLDFLCAFIAQFTFWERGLMVRKSVVGIAVAAAFALVGCGGGDDSDVSNPSADVNAAQGAYQGTTSIGYEFQMLILENGEFWVPYGVQRANGDLTVYGFLQGTGTADSGNFRSGDVKDFGTTPPLTGTMTANYVPGTSFKGTLSDGSESETFDGTAIPTTEFDYNQPAQIGRIAGQWVMGGTDGSTASVAIGMDGGLSGSAGRCSFAGAVTPRASGKNVFDVEATFGGAPCALAGQTVTGIALEGSDDDGTIQQLVIGAIDASRSAGTMLFGHRAAAQ